MTNTVGGIGVLLILNILNCLMLFLVSLISSNVFIPGRMIFDIFLLWTVAYIFVFVVSNIAISVSANKITSVVVVLLILFLIPFYILLLLLMVVNLMIGQIVFFMRLDV